MRKHTTGSIYSDFDILVTQIEKWVIQLSPKLDKCDESEVRARIAQRIVDVISESYTEHVLDKESHQIDIPDKIKINDLTIFPKSGEVKINAKFLIKSIMIFFASWMHLLLHILLSLFVKAPKYSRSGTLFMESNCGFEASDSRFVRFCRKGPIEPLTAAEDIIVKSSKPPFTKTDENFIYTSQPLVYFVNNYLSKLDRFNIFLLHLKAPFGYLVAVLRFPILVSLGRDISYISVCYYLEKNKLINNIVITTSSYASQYLWMRGIKNQNSKLHMIWYSQNFLPKVYKGEISSSNLPAARHMRVDVHWVWTKGFADYLYSLGQRSVVKIVGPILWYLPEKNTKFLSNSIKVAVFDVTPVSKGASVFGAAKNYYSAKTMLKFINDIVLICSAIELQTGKEFEILLKHKRALDSRQDYDSSYIKCIEELEHSIKNFKIIPHDINLFSLLEESAISVSIPYTSTAYVSGLFGKQSIYYDPNAELIPMYESNGFVEFASGYDELEKLLYETTA